MKQPRTESSKRVHMPSSARRSCLRRRFTIASSLALAAVAMVFASSALADGVPRVDASYDRPTTTITGDDLSWHSTDVALTVTATCDSHLDIDSIDYSVDGGVNWTPVPGSGRVRTLTVSTQGNQTIEARCADTAPIPRTSDPDSAIVKIDKTVPTVSGLADPLPNPAGWHTASPVALAFTTTQGPSGIDRVEYCIDAGSWKTATGSGSNYGGSVPIEGQHTVQYKGRNNAGVSSDTGTLSVWIDSVAPDVTASGSVDTWSNTPVQLLFSPAVGASGVQGIEYRLGEGAWANVSPAAGLYMATVSDEGAHAVGYRATNNAGLRSADRLCTVKIDKTPPVPGEPKVSPQPTNDWNRTTNTKLTVSASDALAGLERLEYSKDGGKNWANANGASSSVGWRTAGSHTVLYRAWDKAGNAMPQQKATLRVDTLRPKPLALNRQTVGRGEFAVLRFRINDAQPTCGFASVRIEFVRRDWRAVKGKRIRLVKVKANTTTAYRFRCTLPAGEYRYVLYATDMAGNRSVMTRYDGCSSPFLVR